MTNGKSFLVLSIIVGLISAGCHTPNPHDHDGGTMVAEYRPGWQPRERRTPASAVYVLWEWQPIRQAATQPTTLSTTLPTRNSRKKSSTPWERAMQFKQVFMAKGEHVGFRRVHGQLIAVAGPTTMPLSTAHYCWHMLPGDPSQEKDKATANLQLALTIVGVVTVVAIIVGVLVVEAKYCKCDCKSLSGND